MGDSIFNPTLSMTPQEMKSYGYKIVDLLVDHLDELSDKKPVTSAKSKEVSFFRTDVIEESGTSAEEVLDSVMNNVLSNCDLLPHPKFYSFCPSPSNFISTMADTLATGFNVFSGAWLTSPGAVNIEVVCVNWLLEIFCLPITEGGGFFTSGGSMANMTGIVTARNVKCGEDSTKAVLYLSDQAHSSNAKAARIAGFRSDQIRVIGTNDDFKMKTIELLEAIEKDKSIGNVPFCVIATAGTTNTGSVDELNDIADICGEQDLWLHVDAAYGGAAVLSRDNEKVNGIGRADSITVDPHKWFFQPYEIGCILIRDHRWLSETFSVEPEYLRDMKGGNGEINFSDQGIQLSRRFRALKFYMSLKTFGVESFRGGINKGIQLAENVEAYLRTDSNWEIISPAELAVINYRYNPVDVVLSDMELDNLNQFISKEIISSREAMLATTRLNNKTVLRMCLINPRTTMQDIDDTIGRLVNYAKEYLK
jgi:aromatic-L-amino-acid decarboxylase